MAPQKTIRLALCSFVAAGLLAAPAFAASAEQPIPACGDHGKGKGGKDVKKPKDDESDEKKPAPSPA